MADRTHEYVADARPILKWAGGKRRLLPQYKPHFPPLSEIGHYYEPFIGGAAVFFHLQPTPATLSDRNRNLIDVYRAVQEDVAAVIAALGEHYNDEEYFYQVRAIDPESLTLPQRAARLIFLNRTCYNGLYRENKKGEFNVPYGRYKNPTICQEERLRKAAVILSRATLRAADFAEAVEAAEAGDFVYFDPPYVPLSATSNFTGYDRRGFDAADQRRLADTIAALTRRNVRVMLSNSSADAVYDLYEGNGYRLIPIQARRNINSKADKRGPVKELLILNY